MPIICKIQLDTADFKAELDRIAKLTEKVQSEVSARSETAAQKVGSDAGKAAQSVGKAVEEIGSAAEEAARNVESAAQRAAQAMQDITPPAAPSSLAPNGGNPLKTAKPVDFEHDALKKAVAGMNRETTSSPAPGFVEKLKKSFSSLKDSIAGTGTTLKTALTKSLGFASEMAIIAAGIASIIKIAKTLAIDLPMQKLQDRAKEAAAGFESLKNASAQAEEYRQKTDAAARSLAEFTSQDKLSSLEKEKAVSLIREMSQGYGKLGISIDEATGKIVGYTSAMVKKLQIDKERRLQENTSQQDSARSAIGYYDRIIDSSFAWQTDQITAAQTEKMKLQKELESLVKQRGEIMRSDAAGDFLAEQSAKLGRRERDVTKSEKTFAQSREFSGMSRAERADALRKRIADEQDKIDAQGDILEINEKKAAQKASTPEGQIRVQNAAQKAISAREEILKSRQKLAEYQRQLDELNAEDQRRRDEADNAYAAGLTPAEKAGMLRGRLAAAQKEQSRYKADLETLEKKEARRDFVYIGAGDEDRKLALKEKIVQSDERILNIQKQIAEAEAEAVRLEEEAAEKVSRYLDGKAGDLELARLEAAAEYEKADALRLENELRQQGVSLSEQELDAVKKLTAERNSVALQSNLTDQARDLLDAAKRSVGLDREADEDKAIREAEKLKRGKLDDSERDYVLKLTELSRAVSGREDNPLAWKPDLSVKTNELTARGGFATGAVMPSADQINRSMLSEIKNGMKYLSNIEDLVREGLQT